MNQIPEKIVDFLNHQSCATICTVDEENSPHCFSCYYSFDAENGLIYFKSNKDSLHIKFLVKQPKVSGTVLPNKLNKIAVKGIQLFGNAVFEENNNQLIGSTNYYKKNPLAITIKGQVFTIQLTKLKFIDTTFNMGGATIWDRI